MLGAVGQKLLKMRACHWTWGGAVFVCEGMEEGVGPDALIFLF